MAGVIGFDSALAWAHFRLLGGWRKMSAWAIGYVAVGGGLMLLSVRSQAVPATLQGWSYALLGLQAAILLLFGPARILKSIQADFTTKLIESHRLMPTSGWHAVIGYAVGPACQAIALAVGNFLLGMMATMNSLVGTRDWLVANMLLIVLAACVWIAAVFLALLHRSARGILVAALVLCAITQGMIPALLPALLVPFASLVVILQTPGKFEYVMVIGMVSQVLLATFCYIGAVRKFRRDGALAFGPLLGLALLGTWVALSVLGILFWQKLTSTGFIGLGDVFGDHSPQLIASTLAAMLVAIVPINGAAWIQTQYHRRRLLNDPFLGRRPVSSILVVFGAASIALVLPLAVSSAPANALEPIVRTAIVLVATLLSFSYLLRIMYRTSAKGIGLIILWCTLTWIGPLLVSFLQFAMADFSEDHLFSRVAACSPIGSLILLWAEKWDISTNIGLGVQITLALVLAVLFYASQKPRQPNPRPVAPIAAQ